MYCAPDPFRGNLPGAGGDFQRLGVDEQSVLNLFGKPPDAVLIEMKPVLIVQSVLFRLCLRAADCLANQRVICLSGGTVSLCKVEMASGVPVRAERFIDPGAFLPSVQRKPETFLDIDPVVLLLSSGERTRFF